MQQLIGGTGLMAFWYHFAIMFEALFILTAVDAGTRVARFMLQDFVGNFVPRFRDTSWRIGAWICTAVMVAGWGAILIMGVTDPLGGINTLFPLFGIANQLLAAIALAVCLAIVAGRGRVGLLWVPAVPLAFATAVTRHGVDVQDLLLRCRRSGTGRRTRRSGTRSPRGETSFGTAKTVAAMQAVVRNTFIQGTLSIIFVTLTVIVIGAALIATIRSLSAGGRPSAEEPPVPSRIYVPSGFFPVPAERELEKEWAQAVPPRARVHH